MSSLRLLSALAAAVMLGAPIAAAAEPPAEPAPEAAEASRSGHEGARAEAHHRFIVGVNGLALGAVGHGRTVAEYGAGGFFEVVAIPGWLEVEIAAHYLRTAEHTSEVPVDLVLKKPFHPLRWLNPYVGVGPTLVSTFGGAESAVHLGAIGEVGTYFWVSAHVGLSLEVDYALLGDHGLVQQIAGTSGLVLGF